MLAKRLGQWILPWPARWLITGDPAPDGRFDLIFLLMGDEHTRPTAAARLFQSGVAGRIAFAQPVDSEAVKAGFIPHAATVTLNFLESAGVPRDRIEVIASAPVRNTRDEAEALHRHLDQRPATSVLVVTSAFHSRRARWLVGRALAPMGCAVQVALVPHARFDSSDWWRHETGVSTLILEYATWLHNLVWAARLK